MRKIRIVLLGGVGLSTNFVYNSLVDSFTIEAVLMTTPSSRTFLFRNRIKKLGVLFALDQLCFQLVAVPFLRLVWRKEFRKRIMELGLDGSKIICENFIEVGSVNSLECIRILGDINPDVVVVNGTSIIKKSVLNSTMAIFLNTHVGITPFYRGVHGGYWALRQGDSTRFGVTIHKVDFGIDTGEIIYQATCEVDKSDNFLTYPLLQYNLALPLLKKALIDIERNELVLKNVETTSSKLFYHPTLSSYLVGYIKHGIK